MTHTLKITPVLAAMAAALSLAGGANAEGVSISLAGKSPATVRAQVSQAVRDVCRKAIAEDRFDYGSLNECIDATNQATLSKISDGQARLILARQ